ncbi:hypothetical protein BDR22DRAFT_887245 [Usnea florida]
MLPSVGSGQDYISRWLQTDHADLAGPVDPNEDDIGFTTRLFHGCLAELRGLCLCKEREGDLANVYWNELDKLYLWEVPFRDGMMEIALDVSDELRVKVISLLQSIGKALLTLSPKVSAEHQKTTIKASVGPNLASLLEQSETIVSDEDTRALQYAGDENDQSDSDSEVSSNGEESLYENIKFGIACLMELAPTLQRNIFRGEKARAQRILSSAQPFFESDPAEIYVSMAREKFKQADLNLIQRLGQANWQRHRRIRDMMFRSEEGIEEKLVPGITHPTDHSTFRPRRTFHDSDLGTTSTSGSQYTASAASHTSFASTPEEGVRKSLRVPPMPPEAADGKPFQCFICKTLQSRIRNRIDWKRHVFADLKAYICTFPNCDHELVQFSTRAAWADHEFSYHRCETRWNCPECGSEEPSLPNWTRHMQEHDFNITRPEFQVAKTMARDNKARPIETEECLLCREAPAQNRRAFITHVGRHLEEMALVVLPRGTEDDDSEGLSDLSSQGFDALEQFVSGKDIQVDGEMKQPESTRKDTHCPHCPRFFPSESELRAHVLSEHALPFTCIFRRYGCKARLRRKEYWKCHVIVRHLHLEMWRCDLGNCERPVSSQEKEMDAKLSSMDSASIGKKKDASELLYHDFDTKKSFKRHVRSMHAPPYSSHSERETFEARMPEIVDRCHRQVRAPPQRSRCLYCSEKKFEGAGSWLEYLEHVGEHLAKNDAAINEHAEDEDLRDWMMQHDFIERVAHNEYKLKNIGLTARQG